MSLTAILPSIIVVDRTRGQHPSVRELHSHFRIGVARDATDAVSLARAGQPDLIIAVGDSVMATHDPAAWTAEIRNEPALTMVPLIVVGVPSPDASLIARTLDAGADDCLGDVAIEILLAKIRRLLARREMEMSALRKRVDDIRHDPSQMEALGRLAGGVAHNFNNLLTVILVSSEMLMAQLPQGSPEWLHARETHLAGTRAASLTGQLLAYSGRQMLRPVDVDLNATLADMTPLLREIAGEHVALTMSPEDSLPPVHVDTTQIRRVILDLASHARNAMPRGGTIIVETKRIVLAEEYVAQHVNVQPGVYVLLAISDTGSGMDTETQLHLFEPFFSPSPDAAAGFGLSAVYGIVRQSRGHIWVYSEPGHGTTFKIYLPESSARRQSKARAVRSRELPRGRASVLLVEDEPSVRAVARQVLEACGYRVVIASNGEEALERCVDRGLEPDLLITDVVMPGLTGSQLVARLRSHRDGLRVLYMSGFTEDAVVHHGVAAGEHFLSKPFTPADLAHKVREVLGGDEN